ncbi:uncharacterized protein [Euphorbia lathyris]|uniref:uncharacterized protein isoform X3 n=1 Tax=Euphorbia lathyris TaxID=212925 RepID=UPI0033140CB1
MRLTYFDQDREVLLEIWVSTVAETGSNIGKKMFDLVDYESIDETEFWIIEDENEGELDMDNLENMLEEEYPKLGDDSSLNLEGNEINRKFH